MNKFSAKSIFYLPLMALAVGIIPVLLLPSGEILIWHDKLSDVHKFTSFAFPFKFGLISMTWIEFVLLVPVVLMLVALVTDKKAYHGLIALFLVMGFIVKAQGLTNYNVAMLVLMAAMAATNIMAYLYATGDTFDDWVHHYFSRGRSREPVNGANESAGYNGATYSARKSTRAYKDIVGMTELKEKLLKAGKEILSGNGARNGILLTGEPGNGKTAFAEALAGELKLPLIDITFGNLASMWIGETTQKAMKLFDDAERQAPCVLFIDEIEAVLVDRSKSAGNADREAAKTVSAILKRLVDIRRKKVVLIAATNFVDQLDPAAIREGRFDYKIEITPPDREARKFLLQDGLKSVAQLVDYDGVDRATNRWEGFSVARIRAVATELVDQINSKKIVKIGFDQITAALRNINNAKGNRIPENALSIQQLVLDNSMREKLSKLAVRMTNIEKIEEMGGSVPAGVLFYGPSGTGKTLAAVALAKASGWAFIQTNGHELVRDPNKIDTILRQAKDIRPCIIFIDEADDVLADRRSSIMTKDVTNKLLTIMDGAGGKTKDVLFIAATNAPDLIDEAMLRGGRFTEKIAFDVPSDSSMREYIQNWINSTKAPLGQDFTTDNIAHLLSGETLANVGEILQASVNDAISTGEDVNVSVKLTNLKNAIKQVKGQ